MSDLKCPYCLSSDFELLTDNKNIKHYIVGVDKSTHCLVSNTGIFVDLYCCKKCNNIVIKKSNSNV